MEIKKGAWLNWGDSLVRAIGPVVTPEQDRSLQHAVVDVCTPEHYEVLEAWIEGADNGFKFTYVPTHELSVLSDEEGQRAYTSSATR